MTGWPRFSILEPHHDVFRLDVAMDDSGRMSHRKGFSQLDRDIEDGFEV